ncbi:AbrB family transcriptional regulator [Bosea caraganae]|uniref:AbrB family transcriptional regulator n=1 Tax=Bosea caraganae TaxID=2763117 RepID=A0A370KXL8_9HYPH|nr:AbrB family transcriptional regulator [Bosea caraganae]RDJ19743.1 AbrB family transcriptional regulator [Bosea caraganae]RDJ21376.1 AbrB family transcriptional regulator [Bosea caraganae]
MTKPSETAANEPVNNSTVVEIRKFGDAIGIVLPEEFLARLELAEGDRLMVIEQPDRGLKLRRYDDTHARGLEIARDMFKTYANTLRALAK